MFKLLEKIIFKLFCFPYLKKKRNCFKNSYFKLKMDESSPATQSATVEQIMQVNVTICLFH